MVSYKGPGCVTCLLRHLWPVVIGKKCAWLITWFADLIFSNWKSSWLALKNDFDHIELNFDSCLKQFQRGKWLDNLVLQTTEREKGSGHVPADKLSPRNLIIEQGWIIRCWHLLNTIVMWLLHHNDKELALFKFSSTAINGKLGGAWGTRLTKSMVSAMATSWWLQCDQTFLLLSERGVACEFTHYLVDGIKSLD